ncbi:MAG: DUF2283 domain-containing protein [Dehalococcoidia bacterium]|nr:DUF2283 domain-containing protein [Dehalococcoidia bacterium]
MKLYYYLATDSLCIELSSKAGSDAREIGPDVVFDYDEDGRIVGIDIDHASKIVDPSDIKTLGTSKKLAIQAKTAWNVGATITDKPKKRTASTRSHS